MKVLAVQANLKENVVYRYILILFRVLIDNESTIISVQCVLSNYINIYNLG